MRVLVTGAAGHLGGWLVERLSAEGYDVYGLDIEPGIHRLYFSVDVTDGLRLAQVFCVIRPDLVYHLAGRVGRLVAGASPGLALRVNVEGTANIASLCADYEVPLVHVSTSEVYGPVPEMREDGLCQPNNWYGVTKLMGEQAVRYILPKAIVVRPFMLYSEREGRGVHRSAMMRFASEIASGGTVEVHDDAARGWLHMEDAADFLAALATMPDLHGPLNIGSEDVRPIGELAEVIGRALDVEPKIVRVPLPPAMTAVKRPDLSRQKALGFVPKVTLEDGVHRVCRAVRWAREKGVGRVE
jgi:nucleoside-diphosphate-sugar epimerase